MRGLPDFYHGPTTSCQVSKWAITIADNNDTIIIAVAAAQMWNIRLSRLHGCVNPFFRRLRGKSIIEIIDLKDLLFIKKDLQSSKIDYRMSVHT